MPQRPKRERCNLEPLAEARLRKARIVRSLSPSRPERSTGFQNAAYDHPAFPAALRDEIHAWLQTNAADERKDGQTEEQFLYTTRKKAIGPFKRQLWDLETKDEILAAQSAKLGFLFTELRVNGTKELVERYVTPTPVSRPIPEALKAAVG